MIFLLFFASGISGLIYEVVWLRVFTRIIGVTTYATAVVLAAFMAGLAIGSFIFGKAAGRYKKPLKIYALLQLAIAFIALIMPLFFKAATLFYQYVYRISGPSLIQIVRAATSFILLLIPTTIMGGTLPVLVHCMTGKFGRNLSLLYGLNTLGAVVGVVISGFVTIGAIGEWNTVLIGVLINFIVGLAAFGLNNKRTSHNVFNAEAAAISISPYPDSTRKLVLIAILLSGFTALSYEVIWTRQLILFLKNSIYSFSGMLAIFLTGLAFGSIFMNRFIDRLKNPLVIFGLLELAIGLISILNLYLLSPLHNRLYPLYDMLAPLSRGLLWNYLAPTILVFPLTFLFGAIFPLASLCYTRSTKESSSSVGVLYGFNTVGNVIGALLTGFLFIALIGSTRTIIILGFVNVFIGLILLWIGDRKLRYVSVIPCMAILVLGLKGDPFLKIIEDKIAKGANSYEVFYNRESREGTITGYVIDGTKSLMINGVFEASKTAVNKLMIHIPVLLADNPKKILIICFGMGTTAHSASFYDVGITSVELVPDLYRVFKYYYPQDEVKRFNPVVGDGRNFLLLTPDKYDIITVDPSHPIYSAGTVNLYTREFLELCKDHLTEEGVMCLWYPGGTQIEGKWILKTFHSVFPNMSVWNISSTGIGGKLLIGSLKTQIIDKEKIKRKFEMHYSVFSRDLPGYTSSEILALLAETKIEDIEDVDIITDNHPYLEFPLWRYMLGSPEDGSRRTGFKLIRKRT